MADKMKKQRRYTWLLLLLSVLLSLTLFAGCSSQTGQGSGTYTKEQMEQAAHATAVTLMEANPNPTIGSIGGEWMILGLLKSDLEVPESVYTHYYDNVRAEVKSCGGILSETEVTDYERVSITLAAFDKDPKNVEGYDLTTELDHYERVSEQGLNAVFYALIAANVCGLNLEHEEEYLLLTVEAMTAQENTVEDLEMDYVAMALEAVSFYADRSEVQSFIEKSLEVMSQAQGTNGAMTNCEETAECLLALTQVGVDPFTDERFIKDGKSLADGLMSYYLGDGCFRHDDALMEADQMSAEKALMALDGLRLAENGEAFYQAKMID